MTSAAANNANRHPGADRREHRRARYVAPVEIEWGTSIERARMTNLSLGGMLVEMENPLWMGAEFRARLQLQPAPVAVECVVRRIIPGVGMGVEFIRMEAEDRERVQQLIESLPY